MASRSACFARPGRCSENFKPGTEVSISLNVEPLAWPGFKSNVSIWLGPPLIHSRMHERERAGCVSAPRARASNQPDIDPAITPVDESFIHSRRERWGVNMVGFLVIHDEFRAVQQRPEHVGQRGFLAVGSGL